jgi:branched-chain amino acid transport system permease protein
MLGLMLAPEALDEYWIFILTMIGINAIVATGLNLLTGCAGQISLGHAALVAVGAYGSAFMTSNWSPPFPITMIASGVIAAAVGLIVGIPALRLAGLYLAIATMGLAFIIEKVILLLDSITGGVNGIAVNPLSFGRFVLDGYQELYYLTLVTTVIMILIARNILRSPMGRALLALRDSEVAAETMGIHLARYKVSVFGVSAFFAGIAGSLFAHTMKFIGLDNFTLLESIGFIVMILVGGLGTIHGAIYGAIFVTLLPELIRLGHRLIPLFQETRAGVHALIYGTIIVIFILFEPEGLYGRWYKTKFFFDLFPLYKKETFRKERKFHRSEKTR